MPCNDSFVDQLRCIHDLTEEESTLLHEHMVDDLTDHLPRRGRNTILLLESPHKTEVCKSYPLAGKSGIIVAGAFVGTMGDILHSKRFDDRSIFSHFKKMGVMNVSRLPLQKKAYCGLEDLQENSCGLEGLLHHFDKIKTLLQKGRKLKTEFEETKCVIRNDLRCRIDEINRQNSDAEICYVACGSVAKAFFKMVCPDVKLTSIPHPNSRRHPWFKDGKLIDEVRTIANRFRPFNDDPPSAAS